MQTRILALIFATSLFTINADAQFVHLKPYGARAGLSRITKADLNNDNKLDIVGIGRANNVFNVTALLGDGKGGFSAPVVSAMTRINVTGPQLQAVADFNNDGIPDFAFGGTDPVTGAPALGIMFGKGNGSFEAPKKTVVSGAQSPLQLAAGDFTGHGKTDLVFIGSSTIVVLPGKGNGTFGAPITSSITPQYGRCLAVGDFNNDGNLDLTVGTVVALGNGDGTFQASIAVTGGGCNVAVADLNHDGNLDLITGTSGKAVHVYLGTGTGKFDHFTPYNTGALATSFAVADFDGDGHPDIAVLNGTARDVTVLMNDGAGSFKIGETFNGGRFDLVAGDFNGDNKQDLVISSGWVNLLLGKGNGTFNDTLAQRYVGNGSRVLAADFNNDHKLDLLTFEPGGEVQLGNGNGTFKPGVKLPSSCQTQGGYFLISVAIGDFNNDGKLDLSVTSGGNSGVGICLGNGDGTFQDAVLYDQGVKHQSVATGDFNNDGKLDLAVSDQGGISILLGNGDGTFQSAIPTGLNSSFPVFTLGDFNNDGKLDVAAIAGTTISVLLGKGNGTFKSPVTSSNTNALLVVAGDLNKDGKLDLVTLNSGNSNTISVLLGNGNGTFKAPASYNDFGAIQLALGDFNGDGKLDVAFSEHTNFLDVLLGKGDGTLLPATKFPTFSGPGLVAAGDFNGDGALDLVDLSGGGGPAKLLVFLNTK